MHRHPANPFTEERRQRSLDAAKTSDHAAFAGFVRRILRAMRRRLADSDPEDLYLLLALREELDAALQQAVDGCRANGFSWTDIGRGAGMTRQAAQQRWGA
jgi:hypothetical protein